MPSYTGAVPRDNWEKHGERPSVKDWGAKGDGVNLGGIEFTTGSGALHCPTANWTSADIGKLILVNGADYSHTGGGCMGHITAVADATHCTFDGTPTTTGTNFGFYGTDDTAAIQAALDALGSSGRMGSTLEFPGGIYCISDELTVTLHNRGIKGQTLLTWIAQCNHAKRVMVFGAGSSNVTIDDLILFQPYSQTVIEIGSAADTTTSFLIRRIWPNGGVDGIQLTNVIDSWVVNCQFEGQQNPGYSVHLTSCSRVICVNNNFFLVDSPVRFDTLTASPRTSYNNVLANNVATGCGGGFAYLGNTYNSVVANNTASLLGRGTFAHDLQDGIYVGGNSYRNQIRGNTLNAAHEGDYLALSGCTGLRSGIELSATAQQTYGPASALPTYQNPDGLRRSWLLDYVVADKPSVTVGGVAKTVGVTGDTGKDWYWDAPTSTLTQDAGGTTLAAGVNLVVTFPRTGTIVEHNNVDTRATYSIRNFEGATVGLGNQGYAGGMTATEFPQWDGTKLVASGLKLSGTGQLTGVKKHTVSVPDSSLILEFLNSSASGATQFKAEFDSGGDTLLTTPRASTGLQLNGVRFLQTGDIVLPAIFTGSRPLKLTGGRAVFGGLIDLGSANDVAATGFSSGDFPKWDGSKLIPGTQAVATQSVVTGSRAFGTVYQNTTGKPMTVAVSAQIVAAAATCSVTPYSDSSNPPTTALPLAGASVSSGLVSMYMPIVFTVLPGNYYKVVATVGSGGTVSLNTWTEWY